jgi:hypothetical protein
VGKNRLEAFSDGVLAIIITISVLELRTPHGSDLSALWSEKAIFRTYVLSFANLGISGLCAVVAFMWLVPDRRIERVLAARGQAGGRSG